MEKKKFENLDIEVYNNITHDPAVEYPHITVFREFFKPETLRVLESYYKTYIKKRWKDLLVLNHNDNTIDFTLPNMPAVEFAHDKVTAPHRLKLGNELLGVSVMQSIRDTLRRYLQLEIENCYGYLAMNLPGATLKEHVDIEAGEFVVSIPLYQENIIDPWPFDVGGVDIRLNAGDFVLYSGSVPHSRLTPLKHDQYTVQLFCLFTHKHTKRDIRQELREKYYVDVTDKETVFEGNLSDLISVGN